MNKRCKRFLILSLAVVMLLSSCVTPDSGVTDTTDSTSLSTEAPTDPVTDETEPDSEDTTEALTDEVTEAPTEEDTEAPTEEPTEEETEPETEPPMTNTEGDCGHIYWSDAKKTIGKVRLDSVKHETSQTEYVKKVTKTGNWSVTVSDKSGILTLYGWIGFSMEDFELGWQLGTDNPEAYTTEGATAIQREAAVLQAAKKEGFSNATGYSYALDLGRFTMGDEVHLLLKNKADGSMYCFCELTVNYSPLTANLSTPALKEKYELGYGSDMDMSDFDPIENHEPIIAPDDDPTVKLWFDHLTEKVTRYDTSGKDSGKDSYTIQMGKNEIEGCQFFLYSPTVRKILIRISDFENANGEKLRTELGVEYYVEDGYVTYHGFPAQYVYPDAVIPYDSYVGYCNYTEHGSYGVDADSKVDFGNYVLIGPFSGSNWDHQKYPFRDSIRGFVVEATTTADTTPGAYKATVEIYDQESGKCIKAANLYNYVYNVTLSEETALDTAFGLWDIVPNYMHHYNENGDLTRYTDVEITKAVAEYFLKQRITLTGSLTYFNIMGADWFKNPRVTTVRVLNKEHFDSMKDDPILASKMFYYGQDEPGVPRGWRPIGYPDGTNETVYDNTGLLSVLAIAREADMLREAWGWENYRLMVPFERIMNYANFNENSVDKTTAFPAWYDQYKVNGQKDSIDYLDEHVNVWTSVFTGATPKDLVSAVDGELYMQSNQQDKLFGEFRDRMEGLQTEKGHELWNYVACQPPYTSPYQNILLFNDGTEGRTMFWTTYLLNGTGFLYWHVSYYDVAGNTTYTMRAPFSKTGPGDGILVFPGSAYNQLDPIPSIRLLNMRDGIEEYQLLTMLEVAKGEAFTDELVSHIVTSTVTFTRDDDAIYNVRSFLLRQLEEAE
ncbi:MAG: DUF4091 domain-containing protein [Clostridia bacterium]|nr:DUF4091 domain-containing protein [Clostridia bacterium]